MLYTAKGLKHRSMCISMDPAVINLDIIQGPIRLTIPPVYKIAIYPPIPIR